MRGELGTALEKVKHRYFEEDNTVEAEDYILGNRGRGSKQDPKDLEG